MKLVFLHGFLGHDSDWDEVIKSLSTHHECQFSPKKTNDVLIGYSMGGRIAMQIECKKLILIGSHPGLVLDIERQERIRFEDQWLSFLDQNPVEAFLHKWYEQPLFKGLSIPKIRFSLTKEEIRESFLKHSILKQTPMWDQLPSSFLYIVGVNDQKYSLIAKKLALLYPNAKIAFVEGASHAVHIEKPKIVAHLIEEFIC